MAKICKLEFSLKKCLGSTYTPYWSLTSCKISKKYHVPILRNIQVYFSVKNDQKWQKFAKREFLGTFCPKSWEREFSQIWDLCRKLANYKTLHFRSFLAKTNDSIFRKIPKTLFLGLLPIFGPFLPIFGKMRIFPKNPALSLFYIYSPLTKK